MTTVVYCTYIHTYTHTHTHTRTYCINDMMVPYYFTARYMYWRATPTQLTSYKRLTICMIIYVHIQCIYVTSFGGKEVNCMIYVHIQCIYVTSFGGKEVNCMIYVHIQCIYVTVFGGKFFYPCWSTFFRCWMLILYHSINQFMSSPTHPPC